MVLDGANQIGAESVCTWSGFGNVTSECQTAKSSRKVLTYDQVVVLLAAEVVLPRRPGN